MAGNGRFESASTSPEPSFAGNQCQRGGYAGINLDRCGSFRDGPNGRILNSGKVASRGRSVSSAVDTSNVSQSLMLEPILMDQRNARSVELRRILGLSVGSSSEENSAHLRSSPPGAIEELRRFRASVADTRVRASGRAKNLDEHLHQLNKYIEARPLKKQQRSDLLTNERTGGYNTKMGNQIHRSPLDLGDNKLDDQPKNALLNKRGRTSVAEARAEGRNSGLMKHSLVMPKDRDTNSADSDVAVDKNRRLPAGGESWDKKMKRKRSVGPVCPRPFDGEGEAKRAMHHKVSNEPSMQSSDSQTFRPGSNDLCGRASKMDGTLSHASSGSRATPKIQQDKTSLSAEKARRFPKGNIKLNNQEENDVHCPSPAITKGKASRAPRSSSSAAMTSVSNAPRASGTLESWELPQSMNRTVSINGANTRKRPITPSPCSSPMTQWGGQRPQKSSRTRRANLVSPVSNHDELQTPTEGFSPSDSSARSQSSGANKSLFPKGVANGLQTTKDNPKIAASPARLSDSEESGPGENRQQGKNIGCSGLEEKAVNAIQSAGSSTLLMQKSKFLVKEESSDGLRRQGRGERDSVARASISMAGDKSDIVALTKPFQSVTDGSDRNGSKSGRPLKKLSDRKGYARLGHPNGGSPDFSGELEDDREELLAAANLAYSHSVLASKDGLWRAAEPLFASISPEKKSYLLQQREKTEELQQRLSQMPGCCTNSQGDYMHEEISPPETLSEERIRNAHRETQSKDIASPVESVNQGKRSSSSGGLGLGRKFEHVTSLYQRLLTALIMEDDIEEYDQNGWDGCLLPHGAVLDSPDYACHLVNGNGKTADKTEFECGSVFGHQTSSNGYVNGPYHTSNTVGRRPTFQDSPCYGDALGRANGCLNSEVQVLVGLSGCDSDGAHSNGSSSIDCPYDQLPIEEKLLLELHSIGLYPETVPDLQDKEDESINEEIIRLKSGLRQQAGKKKAYLDTMYEALQGGKDVEGQDLEQVAMDKLVEIGHKKLLSTRGTRASKHVTAKVSKQVSLGFARRTVARCKKFEDSGVSCFGEPGLHDIINAPPPRLDETEPLTGAGLGIFINSPTNAAKGDASEMSCRQSDQAFAKSGPIINRGKKKEVFLDDVGGASNNRTSPLDSSVKWKRSEGDNSKHTSSRNGNAKAGRSSLGNSRGERKPKSKPKQKADQLSIPGSGINGSGRGGREVGFVSHNNVPIDSSKDVKESAHVSNTPLNVLESIEDLDAAAGGIGEGQDLNSWFNEVDGLQDNEPTEGLSIPMDDISQLFF